MQFGFRVVVFPSLYMGRGAVIQAAHVQIYKNKKVSGVSLFNVLRKSPCIRTASHCQFVLEVQYREQNSLRTVTQNYEYFQENEK